MIPKQTIEEIKGRTRIEDLIGSYLNLQRAGSNLKALCPFHSEKTPSFIVFPDTQDFHCFGCSAGGDAISFVMRMENLEYVDAIRFLAKRSGIPVPEEEEVSENSISRSRLLEMNLLAARYFRKNLTDETVGKVARDYFARRGLSSSTVTHFGLGYAPKNWDGLTNLLRKEGFSDREILLSNLARESRTNKKIYDFFNGRVMFPIIDVSGNIVAFGGRNLDASEPKYLNSPESPVFKKSKHLFALNFARKKCQDYLILCEGYMDVIALHQAGFENAVATLGTAITEEHARIFKRYSPACLISYDADAAGQKAAEKAFSLLEGAGVATRIIKVKDAKDPDEYIRKFGADAFRTILDESKSRFEFRYQSIVSKYNLSDPDEKSRALQELCRYVAENVPSQLQREIYSRQISSRMDLSFDSIQNEVDKLVRIGKKKSQKESLGELMRISSGISD
ncbi:MAG: DNA primase, partial [Clostridia bacterium]|nr:DNA primase [Clostridia bacterium]